MFSIKLNDSKELANAITIISEFITEATFLVQKEGLKLVAMDPANISMVILNVLPSSFTEYQVEQESEITVNVESLKQALKRAKQNEAIAMSLDRNKLKILISGRSKKSFYIPLLEREHKERKIPSLTFEATVELDSNEFRDYIEDASIASDAVSFEAEKNSFVISAGTAGNKVHIELLKSDDALVQLSAGDAVRSIYSVEYLKKMTKACALSDTAVIQFAKDYPMRLDFKSIDKMQMSFVLAPRIENK